MVPICCYTLYFVLSVPLSLPEVCSQASGPRKTKGIFGQCLLERSVMKRKLHMIYSSSRSAAKGRPLFVTDLDMAHISSLSHFG